MADPIRRRIVEILASGEHTSGEICGSVVQEFGVTRATASWHLRILRENGWVRMRPDYTMRLYRLDDKAIERLSREVARLRALWRRRIGETYGADTAMVSVRLPKPALRRLAAGSPRRRAGHRQDPWQP